VGQRKKKYIYNAKKEQKETKLEKTRSRREAMQKLIKWSMASNDI
jgi:hypothetical protein